MARIRSVHYDICESETLAQASASAERTFVRLWTACDDQGRAKADPRLLKAKLYPLHESVSVADVTSDLDELESIGSIVRYEVAGVIYLHVPSWDDFQHPNKPAASKLPAPPECPGKPSGSSSPATIPREAPGDSETPAVGGGVEREVGDGDGGGVASSPTSPPPFVDPEELIVVWCKSRTGRKVKDPRSARANVTSLIADGHPRAILLAVMRETLGLTSGALEVSVEKAYRAEGVAPPPKLTDAEKLAWEIAALERHADPDVDLIEVKRERLAAMA